MRKTLLIIWLLGTVLAAAPAAAQQLLMFDSPNCEWCEAWEQDVGVIYDKTPQGRSLPLRRLPLADGLPADVAVNRPVIYTPTFILVESGREVGRITGYPGEDFFWSLLDELLAESD